LVKLLGFTRERLLWENPAAADIMADSHLAVRVPTLHARLLMRGDWASLALICGEHLEARCPWRCDFASLGVSPAAFPRVAVNQDGLPPEPTFTLADALELADAFRKDGSRPLFGRSTTEFFYDITDDDVDAKFKRLQPWTEYEITEDIVDIDPRSGSTWTSCSAFCTLPCCVQRIWTNMDETPILPVLDRENPVLEALDPDETPILPVLERENPVLEDLDGSSLDGFEVIEVLDRETPVLEAPDGLEVSDAAE